jgi:hypothetical protein
MSYKESLPNNCPPPEAIELDGTKCFYRKLYSDDIPKSYQSLVGLGKPIIDSVGECICRSLSVFDNKVSIIERFKNKKTQHKKILVAELYLNNGDGPIQKTLSEGHYSWWVSSSFNYEEIKNIEL